MNIYSKMKQFSNFTPAEQTFVNYILDHPYDIINLHIEQIAKQSYVSISTIYRVIEKLDLTGINQLKWHISNILKSFFRKKERILITIILSKNMIRTMILSLKCYHYMIKHSCQHLIL